MVKLLRFQFDVVYKAGVENKVADVLSRQQEDLQQATIASFPIWQQGREIQKVVMQDPIMKQVVDDLHCDPQSRPGFELVDGILFCKGRLVLLVKSNLISVCWRFMKLLMGVIRVS